MYLKLKSLLIYLVSQNVFRSTQSFVIKRFIRNGEHRNYRRHYNFGYEFNNDGSEYPIFKYNKDTKDIINKGPSRKHDAIPWNPADAASSSIRPTQTDTTPMIFVTIPSNTPEHSMDTVTIPVVGISTVPGPETLTVSGGEISEDPAVKTSSVSVFEMSTAPSVETVNIPVESTVPSVETVTIPVESKIPSVETVTIPIESTIPSVETLPAPVVSTAPNVETSLIPNVDISTVPTVETFTFPVVSNSAVPDGDTAIVLVATSTVPGLETLPIIGISTAPNVQSVTNTDLNQTSVPSIFTEETNFTINPLTAIVTQQTISSPIQFIVNPTIGGDETTLSEFDMTFPYSEATSQAVAANQSSHIAQQARQDMFMYGAGYFTIFLLETARIIAKKEQRDAGRLLQALEMEAMALLAAKKLAGFGKSTTAAFVRLIQMLNNIPTDVVQYEANLANYLIVNRRETLGHEIVNLLDQTDNVFTEEEGSRILKMLEDLDNYPHINKTAREIVHEMMDAVLVAPFMRVYGTPEEVAIVQRLDNLIINTLFSGFAVPRRKGINNLSERITSNNFVRHMKPPRTSNEVNNNKNRRKSDAWKELRRKHISKVVNTKNHITARKIQKSVYTIEKHNKTRRYKIRSNKGIERKGYKIIYFKQSDLDKAKSNVKITRQKAMKESTKAVNHVKTTINNLRYKQKKLSDNKVNKYKLRDLDKVSNNIKTTQQITRKAIKESTKTVNNVKRTTNLRFKQKKRPDNKVNKNVSKSYKVIMQKNTEKKDIKVQRFAANDIREESSFTDEEEVLKANLDDAFFHGHHKTVLRNKEELGREFELKYAQEESSYSDDEAMLKSKIYRLLGYGKKFAENIKKNKIAEDISDVY